MTMTMNIAMSTHMIIITTGITITPITPTRMRTIPWARAAW
jgi:hypothetical protein